MSKYAPLKSKNSRRQQERINELAALRKEQNSMIDQQAIKIARMESEMKTMRVGVHTSPSSDSDESDSESKSTRIQSRKRHANFTHRGITEDSDDEYDMSPRTSLESMASTLSDAMEECEE